MHILRSYKTVPDQLKRAVLAIGNFDGVHRGHQAVLAHARDVARKAEGHAGALLFDPHPRVFFQPNLQLFALTPLPLKLELMAACGLDLAVVLPFDRELAALSADEFVSDVLVDGLGVGHVVIGYDFCFGKGRLGTPEIMTALGAKYGFGVTVVAPEGADKEIFSSSGVRALLRQGEVRVAAEQLGHWWRVRGRVTGGAGRGHGLGFPTANIALASGQELAHGIYAARVYLGEERVDGAAYLGTRPTFDDGPPVLEVFLFDFEEDIYGKDIDVEFLGHIRGDKRFETPEALSAQIAQDCEAARRIIADVDRDDPLAALPIAQSRSRSYVPSPG